MKAIQIYETNLVEEFFKEYEEKNNGFLLFELASANENANTKVLESLLKYNKQQFLNSFLERVGLPKKTGTGLATIIDQKPAIGVKSGKQGFIDLFISYGAVNVVLENKLYGAGDTKKQLARYIATVNGVDNADFEKWLVKPVLNADIHLVYLTADGTKEPSTDSLSDALKDKINYYPINYNDDILPWLEEDVLPNIPYAKDGMMIAGLQQYIAFLKYHLADESSQVVDAFAKGLVGTDKEKYHELLNVANGLSNLTKDEPDIKSLCRQLEVRAESIFSDDIGGDWVLHFTPSFIILYKKSWAALDTRKYSIPSLNLYAGSTEYFLKNKCLNKLKLGVDHLSPSENVKYPAYKFGNHGKSLGIKLLENPDSIKCSDINNPAARKEFYKKIIETVQPVVEVIDKDVVAAIQKKGLPVTPDEILEKVVKSIH